MELPININEFNRKYIEVNSLKFIDPEREKLWFTQGLLNAFDNGENNIEVELDSQLTKKLPQYSENSVDITKMNADIVLCVGGDGTVLQTKKKKKKMQKKL